MSSRTAHPQASTAAGICAPSDRRYFQTAGFLTVLAVAFGSGRLREAVRTTSEVETGRIEPGQIILVLLALGAAYQVHNRLRIEKGAGIPFLALTNVLVVSIASALLAAALIPQSLRVVTAGSALIVALSAVKVGARSYFFRGLRIAGAILIALVLVKFAVFSNELLAAPTRAGWKPNVPVFFEGGVNIEASMVVLFVPFFRGRRGAYLVTAAALVIAGLYLSRSALLGLAVVLLAPIVAKPRKSGRQIALLGLIGAALTLWLSRDSGAFLLERLQDTGQDSASITRGRMLRFVPELFLGAPLGRGAGNGIIAVDAALGGRLRAGNFHNVYAQWLVDFGLQGLTLIVIVFSRAWRLAKRTMGKDPAAVALVAYSVMAMTEFTGLEPFTWTLVGLTSTVLFRTRDRRTQAS